MAIHDWTRVDPGIFHDFHQSWITEIKRALNAGLLPPDYYALAEQIAGGLGPDVLTLKGRQNGTAPHDIPSGGIALAEVPPKVEYHTQASQARPEREQYAEKANVVRIRNVSNHRVVAVVEIVSPGNKSNRHGIRSFVDKAVALLVEGIHLLVLDLFPPSPRDPQGIHKQIWDEVEANNFELPSDRPLTLAAYIGGIDPSAYVQPTAVGSALIDMPLFLTSDVYVLVPLDATYQAAWHLVPMLWRERIEENL